MHLQTIKTELSVLIPKELLSNVDFWYKIRDSFECGFPLLPHSFLLYLSNKYGYDLDILKSQEYVSHILNLSRELYEKTYWDVDHIRSRYIVEINKELTLLPEKNINYHLSPIIIPSKSEISTYGSQPKLEPSSFIIKNNYKPKIKDRRELCDETPIAEFDK